VDGCRLSTTSTAFSPDQSRPPAGRRSLASDKNTPLK
jgi:hypothetical protein